MKYFQKIKVKVSQYLIHKVRERVCVCLWEKKKRDGCCLWYEMNFMYALKF